MPSHLVLTFLSGIIVTGRHIRDRSVSSGMQNISAAFDDHTFSMYNYLGMQMQMRLSIRIFPGIGFAKINL